MGLSTVQAILTGIGVGELSRLELSELQPLLERHWRAWAVRRERCGGGLASVAAAFSVRRGAKRVLVRTRFLGSSSLSASPAPSARVALRFR